MKSLNIYLGDLTHDTVTVANEVFPLNVGFVGSYCISKFGLGANITLFKYIDKLEKAINEHPPDILGLSNYCWNKNIGLEMFRILHKKNPYALTVWGGPNFPADIPSQQKFMDKFSEVDIYVPIDGEVGFSNIVGKALESNCKEEIKKNVLKEPIEGCITRDTFGKLQYNNPVIRITNLDEIPSPYALGLMDKFFDNKLSPMIQTNRGCPFNCTFCTDGSDNVQKINRFSMERVKSDLDYITTKISNKDHTLFISDLNFGMYPRDIEICQYIAEMQRQYNYPLQIQTNTGKNSKEKIIEAVKQLNGALQIYMSVQSTDLKVLSNVRRSNISVEQMLALGPTIKKSNLRTMSEVILALPGETYESHINTLRDLTRAKIDSVMPYTCMMLDGSEMNTPKERQKWEIETKFRILPKDFTKLSNGQVILEIEEVVVSSKTLTFDEYVELRLLAFILWISNIGIVYDAILKLLRENNIDVFELFYRMLKEEKKAQSIVKHAFDSYRRATIDELYDSPEAIHKQFQDPEEYVKLLKGEAGINVLQYHRAMVTDECMDEWTEYTLQVAHDLIKESKHFNDELEHQFMDISNYSRGLSHNTLGKNRMLTNPEFEFKYDIQKWLDEENVPLKNFVIENKCKISFKITEEQFKMVNDELDKFGDTTIGKGQALKQIPLHMLWRHPTTIK